MADTDGMNRAEREAYWRERIAACAASGLTAVRYCRETGIPLARYRWWKGELKRRGAPAQLPLSFPALFAEVRSVPRCGAVPPPSIEIALGGERMVRVPAGFDATTLARVVRVLEGL
jgi:hypothetical protein